MAAGRRDDAAKVHALGQPRRDREPQLETARAVAANAERQTAAEHGLEMATIDQELDGRRLAGDARGAAGARRRRPGAGCDRGCRRRDDGRAPSDAVAVARLAAVLVSADVRRADAP